MPPNASCRRRPLIAGRAAAALPVAGAGTVRLDGTLPWKTARARSPRDPSTRTAHAFFTEAEATFVTAAVARLMPADALGPGGVEAGVPAFIDRRLLASQGRRDAGPAAPALLYRGAIAAIDAHVARESHSAGFAGLEPAEQDAVLQRLERGAIALEGVDARSFFARLWHDAVAGFWQAPPRACVDSAARSPRLAA